MLLIIFIGVKFWLFVCLCASKFPRALGKFFSLVSAQILSLIGGAKVHIKK